MSVLDAFNLAGRKAVITGGSRGLGYEMALALAQAGADVALCSRSLSECREAAETIAHSTGRNVLAYACDVVDSESVAAFRQCVMRDFGHIDILIANAGVNIRHPVESFPEADWDAVVDISLKGSFLCAKAFLPQMQAGGWGRIVLMGSMLSKIGLAHRAAYCAAKAGILGLTRVLALEGAAHGVTANAICPGPFATPMNRRLTEDPEAYAAFLANIPLGRWGEPREIGPVALFLCSEAGAFVTGTELVIDGGWTVR
jgi:NAD(P)-dependent dehydrogenase (short-subunit alcohol dehydrogenase family)